MKVNAKVAWSKRIGLFKHDVGFEFVDVDAKLAQKLTSLAMLSRVQRTI